MGRLRWRYESFMLRLTETCVPSSTLSMSDERALRAAGSVGGDRWSPGE